MGEKGRQGRLLDVGQTTVHASQEAHASDKTNSTQSVDHNDLRVIEQEKPIGKHARAGALNQ